MRDWVIFQAYKEFMILEHMHEFTKPKNPSPWFHQPKCTKIWIHLTFFLCSFYCYGIAHMHETKAAFAYDFCRTRVYFIMCILPFLCCIFHFHYASINTLKYAEWFHMKYVSHFNQFSIKGFRLVFSRLVRRVFINLSVMPSLISV